MYNLLCRQYCVCLQGQAVVSRLFADICDIDIYVYTTSAYLTRESSAPLLPADHEDRQRASALKLRRGTNTV